MNSKLSPEGERDSLNSGVIKRIFPRMFWKEGRIEQSNYDRVSMTSRDSAALLPDRSRDVMSFTSESIQKKSSAVLDEKKSFESH
jgi:hypothetical protein